MKAYDIVGYTYQADNYCPDCIGNVFRANGIAEDAHYPVDDDGGEYPWDAEWLLNQWANLCDIDRQDEATFDSDDFPKVIFSTQIETDEYCGNPECEETL